MVDETPIEYPGLVWVKDPVNPETGAPNGKRPPMRHHDDCIHWYRDSSGALMGESPYKATADQMTNLPPCQTCASSLGLGAGSSTKAAAYGAPCPTCGLELPLTGICDDCG